VAEEIPVRTSLAPGLKAYLVAPWAKVREWSLALPGVLRRLAGTTRPVFLPPDTDSRDAAEMIKK